jgi:hypothetical protein
VTGSRFTPIPPDRVGKWRAIGKAAALHDLLVDRQTDADGRVNYGRAVGYAWIRAEWVKKGGDPPAERTLDRYMQRLKRAGLVYVTRLPWGGGMKIQIIGSAKWADAPTPAHQLNLFAPEPVSITRGKACGDPSGNLRESCAGAFSYSAKSGAVTSAKSGALKKLRKEQEKPKRRADRPARTDTPVDIQAFEERRALLRQQAEELKRKFPDLLLSKRQNP